MSTHSKGGMIHEVAGIVGRTRRVWLLHVGGNAALAALGYAWLWIPDARIWQVASSALWGLALVTIGLWLHGATLGFFHTAHSGEEARVRTALRTTVPHLPALWAWLIVFVGLLWLVGLIEDHIGNWAATTASWLTLKLQKPVKPGRILEYFEAAAWAARWLLIPLALLPVAAQASLRGFASIGACLGESWRTFRRLRYWAGYAVLFLSGYYLPHRLVLWVPRVEGFRTETASAATRILLAYLLAVTSWLLLLSLLAWLARETGGARIRLPKPGGAERRLPNSAAAS